ncbi:response regulator [Roseomonas elaeocarpi]|uniref:Response regulator n=1 Tax=Roseomonas elaeocarpi TaxID=907779 RepID=A0ABV6JTU1_9PROT
MVSATLHDRRILVAEDEYMIADSFCAELEDAGAIVVGPVASVQDTMKLICTTDGLDGAILDVNLRGAMSFPAADLLVARGMPFVFTTGCPTTAIPGRFAHIPRCEKPVSTTRVVRALSRVLQS